MTQAGDLSWFSEALLNQVKKKNLPYDLSGENQLFTLLHPALIKCKYLFENHPQELTLRTNSSGWNLDYSSGSQTSNQGFPFNVSRFLRGELAGAFDFKDLGTVTLTRDEVTPPAAPELKHFLLPLWLDYALSDELWGPAGKWTRFHERLHTLFDTNGLLIGKDFPGYYPLKQEAQWLGKQGFLGKLTQTQYDLIFPWDFPLSGLIELEKILARGP